MKRQLMTSAVCAVAVALILSGCASLGNLTAQEPRQETEAEKEISYPFTVHGVHGRRLISVTFTDSSHLTVSVPTVSVADDISYTWEMHSTLYSWKRGHSDMQLCGISLKVQRESDGFGDFIQFCRKGNFTKPISDPQNFHERRTKNKLYIMDFFGWHLTGDNFDEEYDFFYSSLPNISFPNAEFKREVERENGRHKKKTGGTNSIRNRRD